MSERPFNLIESRAVDLEHDLYRTPLIMFDEGIIGDAARGVGRLGADALRGTARFGAGLAGDAARGTGRMLGRGIGGAVKGTSELARGVLGAKDPEGKPQTALHRAGELIRQHPGKAALVGAGAALGGFPGAIAGAGALGAKAAYDKYKQWEAGRQAGDQSLLGGAKDRFKQWQQGRMQKKQQARFAKQAAGAIKSPEERTKERIQRLKGGEGAGGTLPLSPEAAARGARPRTVSTVSARGRLARAGGDGLTPEQKAEFAKGAAAHAAKQQQQATTRSWLAQKGVDPVQAERLKGAAAKLKGGTRFDPTRADTGAEKRAPGDVAAETARREDAAKALAAKAAANQEALKKQQHAAAQEKSAASPRGQKKAARQQATRIEKSKRSYQAAGGRLPGQGDPTGKPLVTPGGAQLTGARPKIEIPQKEQPPEKKLILPGQKAAPKAAPAPFPRAPGAGPESKGAQGARKAKADLKINAPVREKLVNPAEAPGATEVEPNRRDVPAVSAPDVKGPSTGSGGGSGGGSGSRGPKPDGQEGPGGIQQGRGQAVPPGEDGECPTGTRAGANPGACYKRDDIDRNPLRLISERRERRELRLLQV